MCMGLLCFVHRCFCYFTSLTRSYEFLCVCVVIVVCVLIQWVCVRIHTKLRLLLLFEHKNCLLVRVLVLVLECSYDIWWLKQFKSIIDSQTSNFINSTKALHTILSLVPETKETPNFTFTRVCYSIVIIEQVTPVFFLRIIGAHIWIFMLFWPTVSKYWKFVCQFDLFCVVLCNFRFL